MPLRHRGEEARMNSAIAESRTELKDFLRISNLDPQRLNELLDIAEGVKGSRPSAYSDRWRGHSIACFFAKPSTRTRVSFEAAAQRLGALPIMLRPDELQLGRGEPISDTARVLSGYCSAIVIRTFAQQDVEELARHATIPVINALTDEHHPCQALADLLTLRERFGALAGLKLAYVGDGNNVAHSLMEAGALSGMEIVVASPPGYEPDVDVTAAADWHAERSGGSIEITHDPRRAVSGADAVYTDVWVSMGEEDEQRRREQALMDYQVSPDLLKHAKPGAVFMHCLPAHRGAEVTAAAIDGPQSVVFAQAANRMPTEQAVLDALLQAAQGD
jgi:ornithine carbamoyltransferase